jgi:outer membrane lipoprotein
MPMTDRSRPSIRPAAIAALALVLAACATRPPLDAAGVRADLAPWQVAEMAEQGPTPEAVVLWAGMIVGVDNLPDATEITIESYPLDQHQRPVVDAPSAGRFVAVLPGYVEALDLPEGRFLSVRGRVAGSREARLRGELGILPVIYADARYLWPAGFQYQRPNVSFGVGVSF